MVFEDEFWVDRFFMTDLDRWYFFDGDRLVKREPVPSDGVYELYVGIPRKEEIRKEEIRKVNRDAAEWMRDELFFSDKGYIWMCNAIDNCVGMTWREMMLYFYDGRCRLVRERNKLKRLEWEKLCGRFGGMVMGVDTKSLRIMDKDFSLFIMLKSVSFVEQKEFVKRNVNELIKYAKEYLDEHCWEKIGDMKFYYCSEVVLKRDSSLMLVFSVKGK